MTFSKLQIRFLELKRRLSISVGAEALPEITVTPPHGTDDELSFIRLVIWGYVLIQESGKTSISFLRQLPPWNTDKSTLLPHVRALRTWTSHNLAFDKEQDLQTIKTASLWFLKQCGTGSPSKSEHWQSCFNALVIDLHEVLSLAISACDCFDEADDRERLIEQFKAQLNRYWEAYKFDRFVESATKKFGYEGIEVTLIRNANLDAWRKIVISSTDEASIERNLTLRVESDILKLMGEALPITAEMTISHFNTLSKTQLVAALLILKNLKPTSSETIIDILHEVHLQCTSDKA